MTSSILSKLFWTFAFLCLFLVVNFGEDEHALQVEDNPRNPKTLSIPHSEQTASNYPEFIAAYNVAISAQDPDDKLQSIERALALAESEKVSESRLIKNLYLLAAEVHQERWHIHYAINSLQAAQNIDFSQKVDRQLKQLKSHLNKVETERSLNQDYIATRFSGPAKTLAGKILVAYIFVDDGIKTRWSDKSIQRSNLILDQVQNWNQRQAKRYQVGSVSFINKTFMVRRNPNLKLLSSISYKSSRRSIEQVVDVIMKHLGASNVGEFIENQMRIEGADQGVVIFHSNFDRRSFAKRCGLTHKRVYYKDGLQHIEHISRCRDEYVMLMEQIKRNRWDKLHYVQAHETLHLFGADDLYSIQNARDYAVTDIMNFQSRYLKDSDISPITAYAIGWRSEKPVAPFNVLDK